MSIKIPLWKDIKPFIFPCAVAHSALQADVETLHAKVQEQSEEMRASARREQSA